MFVSVKIIENLIYIVFIKLGANLQDVLRNKNDVAKRILTILAFVIND